MKRMLHFIKWITFIQIILIYTLFSQGNKPVVITELATSVTSSSVVLNGKVNPNNLSTDIWFEWGITNDLIIYTSTPVQNIPSGNATAPVNCNLTGLSPYRVYYFRLAGRNSEGTVKGNILQFKSSLPNYPSSLKINYTYSFPYYANPSDYKGYEYKLIGFPGNLNCFAGDLMKGRPDKDWKMFITNSTGEYSKYNGSELFRCSAGKGFLFLNKGQFTIDTIVPTVSMTGQEIVLPLGAGWNLITNPFHRPVQWSIIQVYNFITEPVFSLNNNNNQSYTFSTSTSLEPYTGYYFYNTGKSYLAIPYSAYYEDTTITIEPGNISWKIGIKLNSGKYEDNTVYFGLAANNTDFKKNNHKKPNVLPDLPNIYIASKNNETGSTGFASYIQPESEDITCWDLKVNADCREKTTLFFSGIRSLPGNLEIYLIDLCRMKTINLKDNNIYEFQSVLGKEEFKILSGKKDEIIKKVNEFALPENFVLGKNYPNPFNPRTTIPVSVPYSSEISITVYNILGKEMVKLYSGFMEPGNYNFLWDGKDRHGKITPTGVYYYCLQSNNKTKLTGKMILMK